MCPVVVFYSVLGLGWGVHVCIFVLTTVDVFKDISVFIVFSPTCLWLSVPVLSIAWKY